MVLPTPLVSLKDHCSIIYNNVLYTYQVDAFQSLDLKEGGTWSKLPMGVPTNGSTCVQGAVNNDNSFIVVGGTTSDQNYDGLQHYSFANSNWQNDKPLDKVARNRVSHGSAYLRQSSSILVYGGSRDSNAPSSQTFLMQTYPPYNVEAFNSVAPPVANPLMIPWNSTHALMLGGSATNTKLFIFGPQDGWHQLNVSLPSAIKDTDKVQAAILDGSDGSKVLELFNMSTSPNQISTLLLLNATTGTSQSSRKSRSLVAHHPTRRRKRQSTLAERPAYNNTLAPQDRRDGFSLASDPTTGLVVGSGGNDQVPLAMFNETSNQWIDPDAFFGSQPTPTPTSSLSSSAPSAPPSSTAAASAAASSSAAANTQVHNKSLTILGSVLGGVFGLAILLVILLLLIKYCRRRKVKKHDKQESSYSLENKAEMDFQDVGADFMKEAGGNFESNHKRNKSDRSDIGTGVVAADRGGGAVSSQSKRALLHAKGDSAGSGKSIWSRGTKSPDKDRGLPVISAPIVEPFDGQARMSPDPRIEPRNDTGWSRYFANNNSKDFATMAAGAEQDTRPATYLSNSQSQSEYTDSRTTSSHPHASAEVEPLSLRTSQNPFVYPPNSRVMLPTGFPRPGLALSHGQRPAPNEEPPSPSSFVSDIDEEDEYARDSRSDGQDSWSPVAAAGERGSTYSDPRDPHVSGAFRDSRLPHPGERVKIPNFPAVPDSQKASRRNSSEVASPISPVNDSRGLRNLASKNLAGVPSVREKPIPEVGPSRLPEYGASQVRTFPRKKEDLGPRGRGGPQTEDMSWLNLGASADQTKNLRY